MRDNLFFSFRTRNNQRTFFVDINVVIFLFAINCLVYFSTAIVYVIDVGYFSMLF